MKKQTTSKSAKKPQTRKSLEKVLNKKFDTGEKAIDTAPLSQDLPQEYRETPAYSELEQKPTNNVNWSAAEDRGEDLIEERDPFIQQDERDTQIPPELIQERAYYLFEQRGGHPGENLADWFEAERQLRGEIASRNKKR